MIDSATTPFYRTILMTLYATGVRRAELAHLKVSDIDSQRMVIHVQGGKGRKDRDIMLSPKLLNALRELDEEETQCPDSLIDAVRSELSFPEQVSLILADVFGAQRIG